MPAFLLPVVTMLVAAVFLIKDNLVAFVLASLVAGYLALRALEDHPGNETEIQPPSE